jgi:hypothetical protein
MKNPTQPVEVLTVTAELLFVRPITYLAYNGQTGYKVDLTETSYRWSDDDVVKV